MQRLPVPARALPMIAFVLLVACSTQRTVTPAPPTIPPIPSRAYQQPPQPASPPVVEREGIGVSVPGIKGSEYLLAADGSGIAFETADGIWAMGLDGANLRHLVAGDAERTLVALTPDEVIYLERQPGQLLVARGRDGRTPDQVAVLAASDMGKPDALTAVWHHVTGDRLTVAIEGEPFRQVDLSSGKAVTFSEERVAVNHGALAVSPDGHYLAYKQSNRGDAVHILDLETGSVSQAEGEAQMVRLSWSPAPYRWAVLAAEPGSDLPAGAGADSVVGGSHIDVGTPDGQVAHLHPPEKLKLVGGPWWSPDGSHLAVESEVRPVGDGQAYRVALWLVDAKSGTWKLLQTPDAMRATGWDPDGWHIRVQALLTWKRIPIDGGKPESAEPLMEEVTLADGSRIYTLGDQPDTPVYIRRTFDPGGVAVLTGPGYKNRLAASGMYAAVVVNQSNAPSRLVILNLK